MFTMNVSSLFLTYLSLELYRSNTNKKTHEITVLCVSVHLDLLGLFIV